MAQNPNRGALLIMNIGANNVGMAFAPLVEPDANGNFTTTATAAIGTAGTFTLLPGGSYEPDGGFIPCNAIYVIGTAAQPLTAYQSA